MTFVIESEKEDKIDLYYCVSPDETEGSIRQYLEMFPMMDEEVLMLLEQASRGRSEYNESFIKVAIGMIEERNSKLLNNFGKNKRFRETAPKAGVSDQIF